VSADVLATSGTDALAGMVLTQQIGMFPPAASGRVTIEFMFILDEMEDLE